MTSGEWTIIGSLLSISGVVAAISVAWGKVMARVDRNKDSIDKLFEDCEKHRSLCNTNIQKGFAVLFEKLDKMQEKLGDLSIKMAKVEQKIELRNGKT